MSVHLAEGAIRIEGDGRVEDAETLLRLLQENSSAPIEIKDCGRLHMAVVQVMMASRRPVSGVASNAFVREQVTPLLSSTTA